MDGLLLERLRDHPEFLMRAAQWFSGIWGIPTRIYQQSMQECLKNCTAVPQWYLLLDDMRKIAAGAGVIDNDFHDRKDLSPNVCALFVQPEWRGRGIARYLLDAVRRDMSHYGIDRLYLVTDHLEFYEKCGWDFLTMVTGDDGMQARLYTAETLA